MATPKKNIKKKRKKIIVYSLLFILLLGGVFFLLKMEGINVSRLSPELIKPKLSPAGWIRPSVNGTEYVEVLVKTSDNIGTYDDAGQRSGNAKQGYIVNVRPQGWRWGTNELDPLKFAIILIPKNEWNATWLEPIEDPKTHDTIQQRKYYLPLETFINTTELAELKSKRYNYGWSGEILYYKSQILMADDMIDNSSGIWNITSGRYMTDKEITYEAQRSLAVVKVLKGVQKNITLVNWNTRPVDWKSHGSSGTFTVCKEAGLPYNCNYSSVHAWEIGEDAVLTGNGPCIANVTGKWDTNESTAIIIAGWTTTPADYIKVTTDKASGARHDGKWTNTAWRLNASDQWAGALETDENHTRFEGLQVYNKFTNIATGNPAGVTFDSTIKGNDSDVRITDSIVIGAQEGVEDQAAITGNITIANNIIYGYKAIGIYAYRNAPANGRVIIYNNLMYTSNDSATRGVYAQNVRDLYIKNNIVAISGKGDHTTAAYAMTTAITNIYNVTNIAHDTTGDEGFDLKNVSFVDEVNRDFHINVNDTVARNNGTDLSSDSVFAFSTDIDGEARPSLVNVWDIGPDEFNYPSNINFTDPTPANGSTVSGNSVYVNVTVNDTDDMSAFIDFNRSLLGWWSFDSRTADGNPYDNSTWGGNGSINDNAVYTVDGKRGGGFEFDGVDDYVLGGDFDRAEGVGNLSVSVWVKFNEADTGDQIMASKERSGFYSPFRIYRAAASEQFSFEVNNATDSSVAVADTGNQDTDWHHVVGVYNGTHVQIYVDSVASDSTPPALTNITPSVNYPLCIGTASGNICSTSGETNGTIDELMIFDRALSQDEINALYNATSSTGYKNNFTSLSDGNYNYTGWVIDAGGNVNSTGQRTVTVGAVGDVTAPVVTMIYPSNNTNTTNTNINVNFTITDETALDTCWYTNDSNDNTTLATCGTNITGVTWSEGIHNITVWANDTSNNQGSNGVTFRIDTTNPDMKITTPANNSNHSNSGLDVNYTISDVTLASCWWSNDTMSINHTLTDCGTNVTTITWSEGTHNVTIWGNDSVGNINSSRVSFRIDLTKPNINITTPINNTNTTNTGLDINYTVSDDILLGDCWWSNDTMSVNHSLADCGTNITTITWSNGQHNVTVWVNDSANNVNQSTISFEIDLTKPNINITFPINLTEHANTGLDINYTASDNILMGDCWWSNDTMSVNHSLADCGTNITTITWIVGNHNVTVWANDSLGNVNSSSVTFNITVADTTNPNILIVTPTNNSYSSNTALDVNYTASDETALDSFWWANDTMSVNFSLGTAGSSFNVSNYTWSEGQHNVTIWANDSSGNENSSSISFTIDITNPDISVITPSNNTNTTNTGLDVNYTISDALTPLSSCWYSNDSMSVNVTLTDCGTNITTVTWSEGLHNVTIWGNDSAGNVNKSSISFRIDTTKPNVNIVTPTNNSYSSNTALDINFTVSDNHLLRAFWWSNDTMSINHSLGNAGSYVNITNITWAEGQHNVTIWVNDSVGNENKSSVRFTIDTINPFINITTPSNLTEHTNTGLDINYTASDTNLASCWYSNDSMAKNYTLTDCGTNITTITWIVGNHNVTIWTNDSAGNVNSSRVTFNITVAPDSTPPTFDNLQNHTQQANISFSFDLDASDNVAIDTFTLNDTTYFNITGSTGIIKNKTKLTNVTIYWLNVTINDTSNNLLEKTFYINITDIIAIVKSKIALIIPNQTDIPYVKLNNSMIF